MIELNQIAADPEQPRKVFDEQELKDLAASVESRGVKQPITVRWNQAEGCYVIIDGERRFRAASMLKLDEIPCLIQNAASQEVLIDQIVHNWQRSELRPYETADALVRLRDEFGLTVTQLSKATGKRKSEVSKFLAIVDKVDSTVQETARMDDSPLTKRHLYNLSRVEPEEQPALADEIKSRGLTAQQLEKRIAKANPRSKRVAIKKPEGLAARQRRFSTDLADIVITVRRGTPDDDVIRSVLKQLFKEIGAT